jgi:hypothetical protein
VKIAALIVWALVIGVAIYVLHDARLFDGGGGVASAWGACEVVDSKSARLPPCKFPLGGPGGRGAWEGLIRRETSAPNVGQQVEDPSLVRKLREAAGANSTVAVDVTVFDAGAAGHAPAIRIEPDDVLSYLGPSGRGRLQGFLERSRVRVWFLEIYEDGDEVYEAARGLTSRGEETGAAWARHDVADCFFESIQPLGPPCPIDFRS